MSTPICILTFHHISPHQDTLTIPPELFEKALQKIKNKYNFITYDHFIDFLFGEKKLPKKSVLLTLDDGYLDNYIYAYPIMKKLNIPGVIFAITGMIQKSDVSRHELPAFKSHKQLDANPDSAFFINTAEIQVMENSGLIRVESHSVTHLACKEQPYETVLKEMECSYQFIKRHTKPKKRYGFCWPKGKFDDVSMKAIRESPYDFAFSTHEGTFTSQNDIYAIQRIDCSSWNGNEEKYLKRIKKKLFLYSNGWISNQYTKFRNFRMRLNNKQK